MLALALSAVLALSTPGTLDRSFGGDGRVVTPTSDVAAVAGVESVPGGRTLLVGTVGQRRLVLLRYLRDGSIAKRSSVTFDRDVTAADTLLDARGRLLVAGSLGEDALVLRFDRAGHLDPGLDGDGIALVDFGGSAGDDGRALALTADGSILLAAESQLAEGGSELGVARLSEIGALDPSFAEGGRFFLRQNDRYNDHYSPQALAVEPDGTIDIGYDGWGPHGGLGLLSRITASGELDRSVGQYQGWLNLTRGDWAGVGALLVRSGSGELLLAGGDEFGEASYEQPWVKAVSADASRVVWGTHVHVRAKNAWASALAVDAAGRAVVAGGVSYAEDAGGMLVARVTRTGRIDRCFGRGGAVQVRFGGFSLATALSLDERGRIVVAGPSRYRDPRTPHRFEIARLRGGGCRR
jgi:uncharacterized delta-60 repeat protein